MHDVGVDYWVFNFWIYFDMKLTQDEINLRVDAWYQQNSHKVPSHSVTLKDYFKDALKHDLYLGQSVMRTRSSEFGFKLLSVSTMYRWAKLLDIKVIRANELLSQQRAKRNQQIVKMFDKKTEIKDIAKKVGLSVPAIYDVLEQRDKWLHIEPKRTTAKDLEVNEVLGIFNHLFIAKAIKTNPYKLAGV